MHQGNVITMSKSKSFKYQIVTKLISGGINRDEAALVLNKSTRTV